MMTDPTVHAGMTRRIKTADGGHIDLTINLSGIPATASDELICIMVGRAETAFEFMGAEIERKAAGAVSSAKPMPSQTPKAPRLPAQPSISADAFDHAPEPVKPVEQPKAKPKQQPEPEPAKSSLIASSETHTHDPFQDDKTYIPESGDVRIGGSAFGIEIAWPNADDTVQPITEVNADGASGGQLRALNAGLTAIGFGGDRRHDACSEILESYGPIHELPARTSIGSLKNLTKAEAHVLLEWIARAEDSHITNLSFALGGTGTPNLFESKEPQECLI